MDKSKVQRLTKQRQVILETMKELGGHPTADEIYVEVKKKLPDISLGTVYRNLDVLSAAGFIKKIEPEHHQMRFDYNLHDHYHLTCIRCHKIEDIEIPTPDDPMEVLSKSVGSLSKYGIFGHRLEFFGLCSECRKKGETLDDILNE
ncbi:MAG: Fur family transcriptional regulator [Desulfatiglandales bacterium]